jgi:Ser/Thr protein kinase RdoA (MazF antagonist)
MMDRSEHQVVERILAFCNFNYQTIQGSQKGYRNTSYPVELRDGSVINIILFKHEPDIAERVQQADSFSIQLSAAGFPTRQSLSQIIKLEGVRMVRYARCYTYMPGETIPWEAYTLKHIKLLGETLANLHAASSQIQLESQVIDECLNISTAMADYFHQSGVVRALHNKLQLEITTGALLELGDLLRSPELLALPRQALHMDFVRGNILFGANSSNGAPQITGIIDFEKAANGPVVFDVARTLAFLLVDCKFKDPRKVYKYFITSGYVKRGAAELDTQQLQLLSKLARFYLVYDFYKFLKHNPYESLPQNEHFLRTRDFLIQDGIIKYEKLEKPYVTNLEGAH